MADPETGREALATWLDRQVRSGRLLELPTYHPTLDGPGQRPDRYARNLRGRLAESGGSLQAEIDAEMFRDWVMAQPHPRERRVPAPPVEGIAPAAAPGIGMALDRIANPEAARPVIRRRPSPPPVRRRRPRPPTRPATSASNVVVPFLFFFYFFLPLVLPVAVMLVLGPASIRSTRGAEPPNGMMIIWLMGISGGFVALALVLVRCSWRLRERSGTVRRSRKAAPARQVALFDPWLDA